MDEFTRIVALVTSVCIVGFGVVLVAASLYGILVWYPRDQQKRVAALKATGRQGVATILEVQEGSRPGYARRALFVRTPLRLAIHVPGIEPYEVSKFFTVPSHTMDLLVKVQVVAVWVDPNAPRDLDKIVIESK